MKYEEEQDLRKQRNLLSVLEVCEMAGTTPSALHALRKRGILPHPMKTVGGEARYYDAIDAMEIIRHFGPKSFPIGMGGRPRP